MTMLQIPGCVPIRVALLVMALIGIRLTNRTYHFAAEFAEVGG